MCNQRPLILISNDDGYLAKGINELVGFLKEMADIIVVAPDGARSGMAAAITSQVPVTVSLISETPGVSIYKCSGTPVDCVKLALETVVPRLPDMVIGGINHGDNSAVNVHYSGTMGVVIEGCMKNIPSIGFSVCDHDPNLDFAPTRTYVQSIVKLVLEKGIPVGTCLNVNFPQFPPYNGVRICRQTIGCWENEWATIPHPRGGGNIHWLTGNFANHEPHSTDTDKWALDNGYISITPTQIDMTAYALLEEMKQWEF
jgi:5'-nucleotidase